MRKRRQPRVAAASVTHRPTVNHTTGRTVPVWPETLDAPDAPRTAAAVGIMLDERFSRLVHTARPAGRTVVTSELSLDLAAMPGAATGSLRSAGELLAVSPDAALAHARLYDDADALV